MIKTIKQKGMWRYSPWGIKYIRTRISGCGFGNDTITSDGTPIRNNKEAIINMAEQYEIWGKYCMRHGNVLI